MRTTPLLLPLLLRLHIDRLLRVHAFSASSGTSVPMLRITGAKRALLNPNSTDLVAMTVANRTLPRGPAYSIQGTGLALVIGHNQKAGGTTLKSMATTICKTYYWHCEFFDNYAWRRVSPYSAVAPLSAWFNQTQAQRTLTRIIVTGHPTLFLGLCGLLARPCVYLITTRAPLSQFWSSYHYFCLLGMEHQKAWTDAQKKAGKCDTPISDWRQVPDLCVRLGVTHEQARAGLLTNAFNALSHPCVWTLDTNSMDEELVRLGLRFGSPWHTFMGKTAAMNVHGAGSQANSNRSHTGSPDVYNLAHLGLSSGAAVNLLKSNLAPHVRCYSLFRSLVPDIWDRPVTPLVTC